MRLVVDTGVFSAFVSRRRRLQFEPMLAKLAGSQLFLAGQSVAELRYGALVAGWAEPRRSRLEAAVAATTVVPVTDALLHRVARVRFDARRSGHALANPVHNGDLWIAATAMHLGMALLTADNLFHDVRGLQLA